MQRRFNVLATSLSLLLLSSAFSSLQGAEPPAHEPIMDSQVYLGYQMDLFNENLGDIRAEGTVFNVLRAGGTLRLYDGILFTDYSFLSQPVKNQTTDEQFARLTHTLDLGLGYAFTVLPSQLELIPFFGLVGQFNGNDQNKGDPSIYYHVPQSRLSFGLGLNAAWRVWGPLSVIASGSFYPITSVNTESSVDTGFPTGLNLIQLGLRLHAQVLPYLGAELGFKQQLYNGGTAPNVFSASWSDIYAKVAFEPEYFFKPTGAPTAIPTSTPTPRATPTPIASPTATPAMPADAIRVATVAGQVTGIIQPTSGWNPISAGALLRAGDALRTMPGASATADFGTGLRLRLGSDSAVLFKPDMLLFAKGDLAMFFPAGAAYAIKASKATVYATGVQSRVHLKVENRVATITVLEGSVRTTPETGEALVLGAGMQVVAAPDSPLTSPKPVDVNQFPSP